MFSLRNCRTTHNNINEGTIVFIHSLRNEEFVQESGPFIAAIRCNIPYFLDSIETKHLLLYDSFKAYTVYQTNTCIVHVRVLYPVKTFAVMMRTQSRAKAFGLIAKHVVSWLQSMRSFVSLSRAR